MVKELILVYGSAILFDLMAICDLRTLVYSFLLTKRNHKTARKIHKSQSRKDRFTLYYIREHTLFPKEFRFYQRCWIFWVFSLLPIYLAVIVINFFSVTAAMIVMGVISALKFLFEIFGIKSQFVGGPITRYEKSASIYDDRP